MVNQMMLSQPLTTPNLLNAVQTLNTSLAILKPNNSETTQLITYALVATVIAGLVVYHYIKNHEAND